MTKVIIYGLGKTYVKIKDKLISEYDIVALTDGDSLKREQCTDGLVKTPHEAIEVLKKSGDVNVLIAVSRNVFQKEILSFLSENGIDSGRIVSPKIIDSIESIAEFSINANFETVLHDYYVDVDALVKISGVSFNVDPFSEIYRENVFKVHQMITGDEYNTLNEGYNTDDSERVDVMVNVTMSDIDNLLRSGHHKDLEDIINEVGATSSDRIIDMGFGFGFSLLNFAKVNDRVIGIDTSPKLHAVVNRLLKELNLSAKLVLDDFYGISKIDGCFDIIYFHASFHHCNDPMKLLKILPDKLENNGRIIFAQEQIQPDAIYPWNIGMETNAAFLQVCKRKWFEGLFREDFFLEMLRRSGLRVDRTFASGTGTKNYVVKKV